MELLVDIYSVIGEMYQMPKTTACRGVGRLARLGGGRSQGVRDRAEHVKVGIDSYFYGGPGGKAPEVFSFSTKHMLNDTC